MADVPLDRVQQMRAQGMQNSEIIDVLQRDGYSSAQIFDALNQASVGSGNEPAPPSPNLPDSPSFGMPPDPPSFPGDMPTPPSPAPQSALPPSFGPLPRQELREPVPVHPMHSMHAPSTAHLDSVSTEEYVEAIIDEKWSELEADVQKIVDWKNRSEQRLQLLSQQFGDLKDRFDKLHSALIGKIESYDKNILEVGAELKAMERVFSKVLPVFTDNVKQLNDITQNLGRRTK